MQANPARSCTRLASPPALFALLALLLCCGVQVAGVRAQEPAPTPPAPPPAGDAGVAAPGADTTDAAAAPAQPVPNETMPAPAPEAPPAPPAAEPEPPIAAPPPTPGAPNPAAIEDASFGAIALTPAPGARIEIEKVPRNVQRLDAEALAYDQPLDLADVLNARLGSATLNDVQNNPLQPDLQYRGFTASPLLGTPQGIAVYQGGVRINEPFGDVVQWDVIPQFAIGEVQLIPGANPVYGLNALGGSLVLRMKDGFRSPGYRVQAVGGSFARYQTSAEYGHAWGDFAVYAGASAFGEQGFRDHSPSTATNLYADVRHRTLTREVGVGVTLAQTDLTGNGPSPIELLAQSRHALYTWPDNTRNRLVMVVADASQQLTRHVAFSGTAYLRHASRGTSNGDEAEFEVCPTQPGMPRLLCGEDGDRARSETASTIAIDGEPYDALYNTTETISDGYGGSLQTNLTQPLFARPNQLVAGVAYDGSHVSFLQRAELAWLTFDRSVQGQNVYLADDAFRTDLGGENRNLGVYLSDTWSVTEQVAINASGRFNMANAELDDRAGSALDGDHTFTRVNPALGVTYSPLTELTLFTGYSEANRAPSASELACADPDRPCRVPNAFIADPPLSQVVSRSVELGLRGHVGNVRRHPVLAGSVAGFGTRNDDDILFVAGSRVGTGFFRNAGQTRRLGFEAALAGEAGVVRWYASYTLLRATFETDLDLPGGANPGALGTGDDGDEGGGVIAVHKGDRIPGLPTHACKAGVMVSPLPRLTLGLSGIAQSSQPFRGDEANLVPPVRGYVVLNAHASYQLFEMLQLVVKAQNLLNNKYETFGVLADPSEVLPGTSDPRFLSPGAPLGVWAGVIARGL